MAKKPEKTVEPVDPSAPVVTAPMLPAIVGSTAKEIEAGFAPAVASLLTAMPSDLAVFLQKRFVNPTLNPQPQLPGMGNQKGIDVSWIKVVNPLTQNKTFLGKRLLDGTVLGKSVLFIPEESEQGFPFIVLGGWEERHLGNWDTKKGSMNTRCQSRDGVAPALANDWKAYECVKCKHDVRNRPKWEKEKAAGTDGDRCKKKMNLIGIGGDFEALYVLQVSGKAIVDFYSKKITKRLGEAANMGLPWYAKTFRLTTVADGTFWTWEMEDILDTVTMPGYPENEAAFWPGLSPSQVELTLQTLKVLQTMANKYITERQDIARAALALHRETGERVNLAEDEDAPVADTVGIG